MPTVPDVLLNEKRPAISGEAHLTVTPNCQNGSVLEGDTNFDPGSDS